MPQSTLILLIDFIRSIIIDYVASVGRFNFFTEVDSDNDVIMITVGPWPPSSIIDIQETHSCFILDSIRHRFDKRTWSLRYFSRLYYFIDGSFN